MGQLVRSTAGRDRGREFIVVDILDERTVFVADGDLRKVERPKKKNVRHVQKVNLIAEDIAVKLRDGGRVTNRDIRAAIEELVEREGG